MRHPITLLWLAFLPAVAVLAGDDRPSAARRLEDPDWVVRALVAKNIGDDHYVFGAQWLRDRLGREKNEYAQAFLLRALLCFETPELAQSGGKELFPCALKALKARSPYVQAQATALLEKLAGGKAATGLKGWEKWWEEQGPAFAFPALPKSDPPGGIEEVKTHQSTVFEEFIYDARRKGLEVVFVLDQTGSMQGPINAAKAQILEICEYIHLLIPKYRVGLVTYDDAAALQIPLTGEYLAIRKRLDALKAAGGGDFEEGVDKGLKSALDPKMTWSQASKKVLIIIGDAPPHASDLASTLERCKDAAAGGWTVNAINVGAAPQTSEAFAQIAAAGKGASVSGAGDGLVEQMLILSLGKAHEKALSGFVGILRSMKKADAALPKP